MNTGRTTDPHDTALSLIRASGLRLSDEAVDELAMVYRFTAPGRAALAAIEHGETEPAVVHSMRPVPEEGA